MEEESTQRDLIMKKVSMMVSGFATKCTGKELLFIITVLNMSVTSLKINFKARVQ
jgi:hypothetical protein